MNAKKESKILISACLLGIKCRYDNKKKPFSLAERPRMILQSRYFQMGQELLGHWLK